MRKNLTAK